MLAQADDDDPLPGSVVGGKYRVEQRLGQGGMGAVYAATHTGIGKRVALKFLDPSTSRDHEAVRRFQREAQAASAIESAHIVHVFDAGATDDGQPYLVMELLEGEDLRSRLHRCKRLDPRDVVDIGCQILRGLARAHAANIVHRDLKPDNVYLCQRESEPLLVKIVDFGISKIARQEASPDTLTSRGTVLGTASYMSPEQAQSARDVDGRADLWSVGAILFEALTGRPPHDGPSYESVLIRICTEDAPDVRSFAEDVPPRLARTIARALARDRDQRPESAEIFASELAVALHDDPGETGRRRGRRAALAVIFALAAATIVAWAATRTTQPPISRAAPEESARPGAAAQTKTTRAVDSARVVKSTPTRAASSAIEPRANVTPVTSSRPTTHPVATAAPRPPKPAAPAARTRTTPKASPAPKERPSGVASGLRLNTREP